MTSPPGPGPIRSEEEYQLAVRELGKRSRPPWMLRVLMNALEAYRQARKMGWSRPQNKDGVTTFASFELDARIDRPLIERTLGALALEFPAVAVDHAQFVGDLLTDPGLRGFVFVHDILDGGRLYEGATVSLGRVVRGSPRHRDRLDIIVEREVVGGASVSPGRMRAYVDPFVRLPDRHSPVALGPAALGAAGTSLFEELSAFYARYQRVPEKAWRHWTQDYIDYFGPRVRPVAGTAFPTPIDELHAPSRTGGRASRPPAPAPLPA